MLSDAQSSVQVDLSGITESEHTITEDGLSVPLTVVRPQDSAGSPPCFAFIHGGGWILGDYPTHRRLVRDLVVASGFPAVFIHYTPSPEAKYPQALDEIYAAVRWVSRNGARIGVDGSRMALAGNSVGGNMAIATALRAKRKQGPQVKLLLLMWPVADSSFDTASYVRYAKQRFLTDSLMKWMFDQYTTDPQQRRGVYVSPLRASDDELRGLPPTYIQVAENDILRDEGEALGRRLSEAGVDATTVRYNGVIHDWGMLNGLAALHQTRALVLSSAAMMQYYLGTDYIGADRSCEEIDFISEQIG
ncbi:MAG: alpha/beta hydrolase [Alistipes sp.]